MNRIEIQQNLNPDKTYTIDEMIISMSMNGWVLQIFNKLFKRN